MNCICDPQKCHAQGYTQHVCVWIVFCNCGNGQWETKDQDEEKTYHSATNAICMTSLVHPWNGKCNRTETFFKFGQHHLVWFCLLVVVVAYQSKSVKFIIGFRWVVNRAKHSNQNCTVNDSQENLDPVGTWNTKLTCWFFWKVNKKWNKHQGIKFIQFPLLITSYPFC